jgi:hypothetical protein
LIEISSRLFVLQNVIVDVVARSVKAVSVLRPVDLNAFFENIGNCESEFLRASLDSH